MVTDQDEDGKYVRDSGVKIQIRLVDFGDRDEGGEPQIYEWTGDYTEYMLARTGTRDVVEETVRQAIDVVVRTWREKQE